VKHKNRWCFNASGFYFLKFDATFVKSWHLLTIIPKMKMKFRILMLLTITAVILNSCSLDDSDAPIVNYQVLPVVEVELPLAFTFGQIHSIPVIFEYTNSCQQFAGFEVSSDLNERVVTVVAAVTNRDCVEELITTQENLRFLAASNGSYVFKFFTGLDVNNEPTYLEYTIPVEE
jgi:hypothetical protein